MTDRDPAEVQEAGALRDRLAALLAEARAAGKGAELRVQLEEFLASGASEGSTPAAGGDDDAPVPERFGMVGDSPGMLEVFTLIEKVAAADVPVLIQGETGSGKELVARALHRESARAKGPFLAENCAAVPPNLLESELFGHAKGSFTGAVKDRKGHFEAANGGTVFLDEIGDMPLDMQAKLLRVLQEGEVRPVGSNKMVAVDVRVLAATHRDLAAMVAERTFREDLYYRLNVITIHLPPLRERPGDVPHLVRKLLGAMAERAGRPVPTVSPEALEALAAWRWPGNVRELENELQRALAFSSGEIRRADLSDRLRAAPPGPAAS